MKPLLSMSEAIAHYEVVTWYDKRRNTFCRGEQHPRWLWEKVNRKYFREPVGARMGAHMTVHASECPIQVENNFVSPKQKEYILRLTFQEASPSPSSSSSVALDPRNMMPLDPKQVKLSLE